MVYLAPYKVHFCIPHHHSHLSSCGYYVVDRLYFSQVLSLSSLRTEGWTNEWPIMSVTARGRSASSYLKQQLIIKPRWWTGQTGIKVFIFIFISGDKPCLGHRSSPGGPYTWLTYNEVPTAWYMYRSVTSQN